MMAPVSGIHTPWIAQDSKFGEEADRDGPDDSNHGEVEGKGIRTVDVHRNVREAADSIAVVVGADMKAYVAARSIHGTQF